MATTEMQLHAYPQMNVSEANWRIPDPELFRQQERVFCILNLIVIVALLIANILLARYWGPVTPFLFVTFLFGFCGHLFLLLGIRYRESFPGLLRLNVTVLSILLNAILTISASTTNHDDSQYYILMCVPVLQAAFHLKFRGLLSVVALANVLNFFWLWQFSRLHSGTVDVDEYVEAGTISFIYTITGVVVWFLVDQLGRERAVLAGSLEQLTRTRNQLLEEEKFADVGRLSAAIANEIRHPIASMANSLSGGHTGAFTPEQAKLFDTLRKDASQLERLASQFVVYSTPCIPSRCNVNAAAILRSAVDNCRDAATAKEVKFSVTAPAQLAAFLDGSQIQQALQYLLNNAIDASPPRKTIFLRMDPRSAGGVHFEVQNSGPAIPAEALPHLFEPFYTTKNGGGGLGLAIVRSICQAHGGEVSLKQNQNSLVCFTITLPAVPTPEVQPSGAS